MGMSMSTESHPNPALQASGLRCQKPCATTDGRTNVSRMASSSIHRLAGVTPDLETVPPNRPFLLGAPTAYHYAGALFRRAGPGNSDSWISDSLAQPQAA